MKFLVRVLIGWGALIALIGAALIVFPHTHGPDGPPVVMVVLDPSLQPFAPAWQVEIGRKFPHAVGILVHGGYFIEGQWLTSNINYAHLTLVKDVVKHVQDQYPDRTVVLLACNVDHHSLGIPGVFYAHSSVWCVPDRAIDGSMLDRLTIDNPTFPPRYPRDPQPTTQPTSQVYINPDADNIIAPQKSRWETDPEVVGNIFEFSTDN